MVGPPFAFTRKPLDTVGEVGSGGQGGEAGGAGGGTRGRAEPSGETLDVDRGRGGDVLQGKRRLEVTLRGG
jgi:hypothetical protein